MAWDRWTRLYENGRYWEGSRAKKTPWGGARGQERHDRFCSLPKFKYSPPNNLIGKMCSAAHFFCCRPLGATSCKDILTSTLLVAAEASEVARWQVEEEDRFGLLFVLVEMSSTPCHPGSPSSAVPMV